MLKDPHAVYVFGPYLLDVRERHLLCGQARIDIPPKVFDALALLLERAGQLVTKDDFFARLWPRAVVSETNLNKIIWRVRRALSDEGETYVQTVPKQGYRFVGAVRVADGEAALAQGMAPLAQETDAPVHVDTEASSDVPADVDDVGSADAAVQRTARMTRYRRAAWVGLPMLLAIFLLVLSAIARRQAPPNAASTPSIAAQSSSAPAPTPSLIVLPFRMAGSDADDRALADGLSDELIALLARIDGLRVVAAPAAGFMPNGENSLAASARRLGIRYAIDGSAQQEGDQLHASLRLVEIASSEVLWSETFEHVASESLALERDATQAVAAALALKLSVGVRSELERSEDAQWYRRYLQARHGLRRDVVEWKKAIADFRALVADAPTYARAHSGLALALTQPSYADEAEAQKMRVEAEAHAQIALKLDPALADPYAVLADAKCRRADWEPCMALTRHALKLAPADTTLRSWYARRLTTLGYVEQALAEMETARGYDPFSVEVTFMLAHTLDTLGRHEDAARHYASVVPKKQTALWFNAVWRGDWKQARECTTDDPRWHAAYLAILDALEDPSLWPAARTHIRASERPQDGQSNWARVLDPQADIRGDIAILEDVWRKGASSMSSMLWNPELAGHRRHVAFGDYLQRTGIIDYWRVHGWPKRCRPAADTAQCD
ncbi:MAG: winged helix-turn-helix domain-containing protein [Proteobacteria bacterium]|uniref:winged helix-turn-helix domain-containing protein n=1 Tax=Rudaea sp. TaxID=2136325 RepID=UPI00321FA778|nr:winged helix-turn-helix domain-containing protein [Pseudomonadota bacterium]